MKEELLPLLRCSRCQNRTLHMNVVEAHNNEIREGLLICNQCNSEFPIHDGIPEFLYKLTRGMKEEIESNDGYAKNYLSQHHEIYNDEFLLALPHIVDKRTENAAGAERKAHYFFQILNACEEGRGRWLLELGAYVTWATRYFAKKGYKAIALDIVKSLYRGLISREVYFQKENIYYEAVLSPMENLPLGDSSIDIVFSINSLHHSYDLNAVFSEVYRVLKKGGIFYLMEDGVGLLFLFYDKIKTRHKRKTQFHQDHTYMFIEYKNAIAKASLTTEMILPIRFMDRIGFLKVLPTQVLTMLYKIILYLKGCGFILKIQKIS